ncbi:hypothetical protein [Streptomyces hokutonensis]|uniref:hypothetical protein n=1 Tax=Streptomyces hokutonensis TaxID=1306990 RepID=UPI0033D48CF6
MESRQPGDPAPEQRTVRSRFAFLARHYARRPWLLVGLLAWTGCATILMGLLPPLLSAIVWAVFFLLGMLFFYPDEIDR